ncbi:MAG: NAD(P)/FAD-dependent oxidoreductase [Erysipelotrichaceae bacterium]|nr:NAD(P)/FAD-dependent oxidoreductase [Erysipelotrichaceae bacterium]
MHYDVIIVGGGISGCSIAYSLSQYQLKVALFEKENDVAMKTTKANSGIVHAGYDPKPGTKMARLNVRGSAIIHDLAPKLGFRYNQIGSVVVGQSEEEHRVINELYRRGVANGVPELKILKTQQEVHAVEPYLAPEIDYALYAPTAAICSPWELCLALAYNAKVNGVDFYFNQEVKAIQKEENGYRIVTNQAEAEAEAVINAAGVFADHVYELALGKDKDKSFHIVPCKGEYYLLDKEEGHLTNTVVFQCPTKAGKGVLVSRTVHGNLIVGPNADFQDNLDAKEDVSTTSDALRFIREMGRRSIPSVDFGTNIRNFSGVRATLGDYGDFWIEESPYLPKFYNFAGIKSPGLSSAPAFGEEAVKLLTASGFKLTKKEQIETYVLPKSFRDMTLEEQEAALKKDRRYGQIICRCETVPEAEIIAAMHAPIPGTTIDGIKRRCNAGMGRCQGGFCGPKIFHLLMEELHLSPLEVYQDREGSSVVVGKTKEGK